MNIEFYKEFLNSFISLKHSNVSSESTLLEISNNIGRLKDKSIAFKKNEQIIDLIDKKISGAIQVVKRKRVYKEIDLDFSSDLLSHLQAVLSLDDDSFQLDNNDEITTENVARSSRQGEFHPKPLTEPYVIVSHHTALVVQT